LNKLLFLLILLSSILYASYDGKVIDKSTKQAINNVTIAGSNTSVQSDNDGFFSIQSRDENYTISAKDYKIQTFSIFRDSAKIELESSIIEQDSSKIELEPSEINALYLTFWGANIYSKTVKRILNIVKNTKINAIIVDVKNEYGYTSYKTSVDQANSYGAAKKKTIGNMENFMRVMKENNIYMIARIAVFKDELQAINNKDYAIKKIDGTIWRNHDDMAWVDPFDERSHAYTIAIAEDAAKMGFDEINFDYIRFPARSGLKLSKKNNQKNRVAAIEQFLKSARITLKKHDVFISVDVYGNICWAKDDTGIGQTVESLAKYSDYLYPMLYPSGYADDTFGRKYPAEHPYEVISKSLGALHKKIDEKRVRPWLQFFKDYSGAKKPYNKLEINEQIRAAKDLNTSGWLFWSPSSRYNLNYFK